MTSPVESVIQQALANEGRIYFDAIGLAVIAADALRQAGLICSCPHPMRCYRCALNERTPTTSQVASHGGDSPQRGIGGQGRAGTSLADHSDGKVSG